MLLCTTENNYVFVLLKMTIIFVLLKMIIMCLYYWKLQNW